MLLTAALLVVGCTSKSFTLTCDMSPVLAMYQEGSTVDSVLVQYMLPDGEYATLGRAEVTENIELSTSRLRKASTVKVIDHTEFGMIADKQNFTIYEGDWGDYYAARIEVWYKNARTGKETKLLEKIYRVEGWMR